MIKTLVAAATLLASAAVSAEPATYAIDPNHTIVTFEALHLGTSTQRGRLQAKQGTVTLDRAAKTGKVDITLDLSTVSAVAASLTSFLQGERFFNVAQNPTAHFVADAVTFDGDKLSSVSGTLTLMGKSQPVVLSARRFNCYENSQLKREVCGGDFVGSIQRSQYGLGALPTVTPDEIPLLIEVEGIRQ
jgi:polyisoprenoid-binding protein YceI